MGRPPIGKTAMSGAERQRKYLARLLSGAKPSITPAPDSALVQELAQAKARIAVLAAIDEATEEIAKLKARIAELQTENAALKHALAVRRKPQTAKALKAKPPPVESEEIGKLKAQIAELDKQLDEVTQDRNESKACLDRRLRGRKGSLVLPRALEPMVRLIRAGLHPERAGTDAWFKLWQENVEIIIVDGPEPKRERALPGSADDWEQAKRDKQYADHVKRSSRKKK